MSLFGCLVTGRLVQTNYEQVDHYKFVFNLEDATTANFISIFLTGVEPLPDGAGAKIFFGWPPYDHFQFVGFISNEKPSLTFKVTQVRLTPPDRLLIHQASKKTVLSSTNTNNFMLPNNYYSQNQPVRGSNYISTHL